MHCFVQHFASLKETSLHLSLFLSTCASNRFSSLFDLPCLEKQARYSGIKPFSKEGKIFYSLFPILFWWHLADLH